MKERISDHHGEILIKLDGVSQLNLSEEKAREAERLLQKYLTIFSTKCPLPGCIKEETKDTLIYTDFPQVFQTCSIKPRLVRKKERPRIKKLTILLEIVVNLTLR